MTVGRKILLAVVALVLIAILYLTYVAMKPLPGHPV